VRNLHLKTFEDAAGESLSGSDSYRLSIPAHVPTTPFWAVEAYDAATAGLIRELRVVGLDSFNPALAKNPDGSVDL
jgi:hypothetical protein